MKRFSTNPQLNFKDIGYGLHSFTELPWDESLKIKYRQTHCEIARNRYKKARIRRRFASDGTYFHPDFALVV